jgi:fructosamine-3-kinase
MRERLHGGLISATWRIHLPDGTTRVRKEGVGLPAGLYAVEARSLAALRVPGAPAVPRVLGVGPDWLELEDLGPQVPCDALPHPAEDPWWDGYGRALAHLHGCTYSRCGWWEDTYWGTMRMDNRWNADGAAFYAEQRFRWFLRRPAIQRLVPEAQRRQVDRLAERIGAIVPPQPACLNHGDLWAGNRAVTRDGRPAMIDPCVHAGWASCDLHNCLQYGGFPERFFAAYRECRWLPADWRDHARPFFVLHHLGLIDQGFGDAETWMEFRQVLTRFAGS